MKHPNGYGSVYKLPGHRRRPWVARVTTGWETAIATKGKREGQKVRRQLFYIVGYFETRLEALAALSQHHNEPITPKAGTTLEKLYEGWSKSKYKKVSNATADSYRYAWNYISHYGDEKFRLLRTSHWQKVIDDAAEQGLSQSLISKVKTLIVLLSNHAMKDDIIKKNYGSLVDMPQFDDIEKDRFTDLEVKNIQEAAVDGVPWADTVLMLIRTGFRISEFTSLTRFNVDLKNNIITGGSKSVAGKNRPIPIHKDIEEYVKKWFAKSGKSLVCKEDGSRLTSRKYREDCYMPALKEIGVRQLRPHACRHTFCTLLAEAGVDPLYIKFLAGHAQYSFTADNYTHPDIEKLREAISKL